MSKKDSARAKWRADLHEYGASVLREAGLTRMAEDSEVQVLMNREYAELMDKLTEAKASGDKVYLKAVKLEVSTYRKNLRLNGPARPGVVNNFEEPSDEQLEEMGY